MPKHDVMRIVVLCLGFVVADARSLFSHQVTEPRAGDCVRTATENRLSVVGPMAGKPSNLACRWIKRPLG